MVEYGWQSQIFGQSEVFRKPCKCHLRYCDCNIYFDRVGSLLGFREIYIIGCDNSYGIEILKDGTIVNHNKQSYFEGSDAKSQKVAASTWQMNIAYEYARKYADANGIKIFNATRGGYLEAFERVDFDTLFS